MSAPGYNYGGKIIIVSDPNLLVDNGCIIVPNCIFSPCISTKSGNLNIKSSSGTINIAGINYPSVDGTEGQVLTTDGSGNSTFTTKYRIVGISDSDYEDGNSTYTRVNSFYFEGTIAAGNTIRKVNAIVNILKISRQMSIRLQDITNGNTVAELTNIGTPVGDKRVILTLNPENVPSEGAVFEVQILSVSKGKVRFLSLHIYY